MIFLNFPDHLSMTNSVYKMFTDAIVRVQQYFSALTENKVKILFQRVKLWVNYLFEKDISSSRQWKKKKHFSYYFDKKIENIQYFISN